MLTELETTLLGIMMMIIMLGMGCSMTYRDFLLALRKPRGILVGLVSQYMVMPFLGYLLAVLLGLPPAMAAGLILIGCMPGGTTSNIFTYFSKGVLALSIMMTTVSTLVAVVTVPLLLQFYGGLAGLSGDYVIPPENVAQGVAVILFLIASWVPRNYGMLLDTPLTVFAAVICIGLLGVLFGYWLSRALGQDRNRSRTISLETGIQNGPLAVLIITLTFTGTMQQEILFIPILYSLFIVIMSSLITILYRRSATAESLARDKAKVAA